MSFRRVSLLMLAVSASAFAQSADSGNAAAKSLENRLLTMTFPSFRTPPSPRVATVRMKVVSRPCSIPLVEAPVNRNGVLQQVKPRVIPGEPVVAPPAPSCDDVTPL